MKGKICCKILFLSLLFCFFSVDIQAQRLKAKYWEEYWEKFPRPVYDYSISGFQAVKRRISRKYFSTNSGFTGELYEKYYQFQFPDQGEIDAHKRIKIRIPPRERLLDIDYRVWKNGLLIYEARPASINSQLPSRLINSSLHADSFFLDLNFLEPECTVELIITCKGIPLPYQLFFKDDMPIKESIQEIIIISQSPLRFKASSQLKQEEFRKWDNKIYQFTANNLTAGSSSSGFYSRTLTEENVQLDWQDQVYYYDREETDNWQDLLSYLFYDGLVRDFSVYRNSLSEQFGHQQFYGPWQRPRRFYRHRDMEIGVNEEYAQGSWRLTRAYADRWLQLEEFMEKVKIDTTYAFPYALQHLHHLQEKAIREHLAAMPEQPKVFTEYGLIYSFYQQLFQHFKIPYRLALVKSAVSGAIEPDYISPWQFQARSIAYRSGEEKDWRYIFAGPMLGDFAELGEIPSPFAQAQALLFNPLDSFAFTLDTLIYSAPQLANFNKWVDINFNDASTFFRAETEIGWDGVFRSKLLQDYILRDSLQYFYFNGRGQLEARNWQGENISVLDSYRRACAEDSLTFSIPLNEIGRFPADLMAGRFCLPYLPKAEWHYVFNNLPAGYLYKVDAPSLLVNEDFSIKIRVKEKALGQLTVEVFVEIRTLCYNYEVLNGYLQILNSLNEGVKITIWKN
jgi:hypothetical protein